jgi:3-dehydroquinate synthase
MQSREETTDLRVAVDLGPRSYEVRVVTGQTAGFGPFVRGALESRWSGRSCRSAMIVTDRQVAELGLVEGYREALAAVGIAPALVVLSPGEATKSLAGAALVYDQLVFSNADRHTAIVALGGGVIGDLAGFVAATYARGIPLVMVPTTLLSQVDSSVGGKVGVNLPGAKNIVGAFHQPVGVWIDTATLRTLPDRELRCGMAEVVKYGVILDGAFFEELEDQVEAILGRDDRALRRVVARSCQLKASVVSRDEREETGLRAVLNFGHTI